MPLPTATLPALRAASMTCIGSYGLGTKGLQGFVVNERLTDLGAALGCFKFGAGVLARDAVNLVLADAPVLFAIAAALCAAPGFLGT